AAFQQWLDEDVLHRVAFLRLDAVWQRAARLKVLGTGMAPGAVPPRGTWASSPFFEQAMSTAAEPDARCAGYRSRRRPRRRHWLAAGVAAALVAIAVAAGSWFWSTGATVHHGEWRTAIGRSQVVHLADGSTVTLAGDSRIRTSLDRNVRNIELMHGE